MEEDSHNTPECQLGIRPGLDLRTKCLLIRHRDLTRLRIQESDSFQRFRFGQELRDIERQLQTAAAST